MGAETQIEHVKITMTRDEARKCGEQLIEQAKYDHGHAGYSGTFAECTGVVLSRYECTTYEEAREHLVGVEGICEKWGPLVGISLPDKTWVFGAICSS
jgi:hypothetical protein